MNEIQLGISTKLLTYSQIKALMYCTVVTCLVRKPKQIREEGGQTDFLSVTTHFLIFVIAAF